MGGGKADVGKRMSKYMLEVQKKREREIVQPTVWAGIVGRTHGRQNSKAKLGEIIADRDNVLGQKLRRCIPCCRVDVE